MMMLIARFQTGGWKGVKPLIVHVHELAVCPCCIWRCSTEAMWTNVTHKVDLGLKTAEALICSCASRGRSQRQNSICCGLFTPCP